MPSSLSKSGESSGDDTSVHEQATGNVQDVNGAEKSKSKKRHKKEHVKFVETKHKPSEEYEGKYYIYTEEEDIVELSPEAEHPLMNFKTNDPFFSKPEEKPTKTNPRVLVCGGGLLLALSILTGVAGDSFFLFAYQ